MAVAIKAEKLFKDYPLNLSGREITSIEYDSRKVSKGSCFVALKGYEVDGHDYIKEALKNGACVVVAERDVDCEFGSSALLKVDDSYLELAKLSDRFYDHPSKKLGVIGITGTNGKTTVAYLIEKILNDAGFSASRFGTTGYGFPDEALDAPNTTPISSELQKMFFKATSYKNPRSVIEVSSHGLALGRLERTVFKGTVFTNLSQDHLDFHPTMSEYQSAKEKLFTKFDSDYAVINIDDKVGSEWVLKGLHKNIISYGASQSADVRLLDGQCGWDGNKIKLSTPLGELDFKSPLPGKHNIYNVMACVAFAVAEKLDIKKVINSLESFSAVPGRFEKIEEGQDFAVVVDYAHTDNALQNIISAVAEITDGKVIVMFGCGGDRDKSKRKLMGKVADKLADILVVTSDNPRTEEPKEIIKDILKGVTGKSKENLYVIESREKAIDTALSLAKKGDSVLLAGKGHENYQIIGKEKIHFDDRETASKFLRRAD